MTTLIVIVVAVVVVLALLVGIVKSMWRVAEPNEALVISGAGAMNGEKAVAGEEDVPSYKIAVGKGALVIPGLQTVRRLSLNAHKADLQVTSVTQQGIPVQVRGVVIYKVGNTSREIANAASRFLGTDEKQDAIRMADTVDELFAGHLRSILGGLTMEQIIQDRSRLAQETRDSSAQEMETLGLKIDSLQIQEVDDPSGYIASMAAPHQAAIEASARIAQAERNQEATIREQAAASTSAKAVSESQIAQSRVKAESDKAEALSAQAGPLAAAQAQKEVVVQQTEVAKLEAARREMELQTEIVKPAEADRESRIAAAEAKKREVELSAEADAIKVDRSSTADAAATQRIAEADAAAIKVKGAAEASAIEAKLTAEASGIEKRGQALEKGSDAVIAQTLAEKAPELVRAAAESFKGIDSMTVFNGAEGVTGMAGEVMKMGLGLMPLIQQMLKTTTNGHREPEKPVVAGDRTLT